MGVKWKPIPEQFLIEYRSRNSDQWQLVDTVTGRKVAWWVKELLLWVVVPEEIRVRREESGETVVHVHVPDPKWG